MYDVHCTFLLFAEGRLWPSGDDGYDDGDDDDDGGDAHIYYDDNEEEGIKDFDFSVDHVDGEEVWQ